MNSQTADGVAQRFWSKVRRNAEGGCWVWTAARNARGYGSFQLNGKNRKAHRVAYEISVGPIDEGLQLDHLCKNTSCVNPDHLEPVTGDENSRRAGRKGASHCRYGHEFSEANTYLANDGRGVRRRVCRTCKAATRARYENAGREARGVDHKSSKLTPAMLWEIWFSADGAHIVSKRLGLNKSTVLSVRRGETWQHVTKDFPEPPKRAPQKIKIPVPAEALRLLANGASYTAVGKQFGVDPATARRWSIAA